MHRRIDFKKPGWMYLLLMSLALSIRAATPPSPGHLNIIIFYADDLGWMDLGIQGSPYYETPNIDRLAAQGMRFTRAYSNAANCAPSRACLMTGMYTARHGIYTVANSDRGQSRNRRLIPIPNTEVLDTSFLTLPAWLQGQGYKTCIAGKWHLSGDPKPYGFNQNFGGHKAGYPRSYFSPFENPFLPDGPEGEHLPDRLARDICTWMERVNAANDPFFIYFPFYSVHTPIQARPDLEQYFAAKQPATYHNKPDYAAMIAAMDAAVGKVMKHLDSLGLTNSTLIIFTSDNGAHGAHTLSRPLRGAKGMYYEGGIRVPMLVQWPGVVEPGAVSDLPVIGSDVFPTLMEIVAPEEDRSSFDGQSFLPALQGKEMLPRPLFWHFPAYLESYEGDRAFADAMGKPHWRTTPCSVVMQGDWKLIRYFEDMHQELYHLGRDIGERRNLASRRKQVLKRLSGTLDTWLDATEAPIPNQANPAYKP